MTKYYGCDNSPCGDWECNFPTCDCELDDMFDEIKEVLIEAAALKETRESKTRYAIFASKLSAV